MDDVVPLRAGHHENVRVGADVWIRPSNYDLDGYPIHRKLVESIDYNTVDEDSCVVKCPVELIHGMLDQDVPYESAMNVSSTINTNDVIITLAKDGYHRLSSDAHLAIIGSALDRIISKL